MRRDNLGGLKRLPLVWKRVGVRPTNSPERRLAGAAFFLARTAREGLAAALARVWDEDLNPVARRRAFEALFPRAMGFWSTHCTWAGKKLQTDTALIGQGRIRSIIGNVFIPAALALARQRKDRRREERVFELFSALPKESENHILKIMAPRVFGLEKRPRLSFRTQQGLLQIYQDWCEPNPSCHNCSIIRHLDGGGNTDGVWLG